MATEGDLTGTTGEMGVEMATEMPTDRATETETIDIASVNASSASIWTGCVRSGWTVKLEQTYR